MSDKFTLEVLPGVYSIVRLEPDAPIPAWATAETLFSVSRTADELSVLCPARCIPEGQAAETGLQGFRVKGPLAFSAVGILAALVTPLAQAGISIFSLSTYDTDYIFVSHKDLDAALAALRAEGHRIHRLPGIADAQLH